MQLMVPAAHALGPVGLQQPLYPLLVLALVEPVQCLVAGKALGGQYEPPLQRRNGCFVCF